MKGLNALGFEFWLQKKDLVDNEGGESQSSGLIQTFGKLGYFLVFLLFLPSVFDSLNMQSVSKPIKGIMSSILNFTPNIMVTVIILVISIFLQKS